MIAGFAGLFHRSKVFLNSLPLSTSRALSTSQSPVMWLWWKRPWWQFCEIFLVERTCLVIKVFVLCFFTYRRLLLVFDNVFEVDISAVFKNNCLRGNIYIRLSFVFSMFSIQSQHFLVDSDAPPPFLCYRKHHQTAMEQRLQRFCLLTFHPSSIFLTHFS